MGRVSRVERYVTSVFSYPHIHICTNHESHTVFVPVTTRPSLQGLVGWALGKSLHMYLFSMRKSAASAFPPCQGHQTWDRFHFNDSESSRPFQFRFQLWLSRFDSDSDYNSSRLAIPIPIPTPVISVRF